MSSERGALLREELLEEAQKLAVLVELLEDVTLPAAEVDRVENDCQVALGQVQSCMWRGIYNGRVMRGDLP